MDLNKHSARLHTELVAAAALGDETTRATAEALARAVDASARMVVLDALTEFASEVGAALDDRSVHVVLDGDRAVVDVRTIATTDATDDEGDDKGDTDDPADARADAGFTDAKAAFDDVTGEISRVTLRLVEQMKTRAEDAAAQNGQSLNSWMSQAVQGALRDQMRKNGNYRR